MILDNPILFKLLFMGAGSTILAILGGLLYSHLIKWRDEYRWRNIRSIEFERTIKAHGLVKKCNNN